jgi:hypothetical protein
MLFRTGNRLSVLLVLAVLVPGASARGEQVDLELVLSVDSSGSIDSEEFDLQRLGYAKALTSPRVLKAIRSGPHRAIAVTFVEWSGPGINTQVVRWTRIASRADAEGVAAQLIAAPRTIFGGGTSLGAAIDEGAALFADNGFESRRQVIDISGDGFNNRGWWPEDARNRAVRRGITINGLPILDFDDGLADYFRRSVIGGLGAFVIAANGFDDFARSVIKKLIREIFISERPARHLAGAAAAASRLAGAAAAESLPVLRAGPTPPKS